MALMTAKEYIDSLRRLNTRVYMFGEKLDNWVDHPMIRPSINCVAMTYALAQDPQYADLMTATSSLTGRKINRFTHLHQSADDLVKKVKMQRLLGQKTASCFQRRPDGIVVCGAKCHQTGSINSHWHIFMPTIAMGEADKDYAVSFACPTDAEGLYMIYGRQSCDTRKLEDGCIDVGNAKFGGQEALVVLDHVFIPNEYIFLNGEYEFAGMIVERFAGYHRQSYGGCKVGVGDVVIGAAALAAEYNGVEKASAVKDKLIEMTHLNETLYSCGIACSCEGCPTKAGNYQIDLLLANVCKQNVTRFPYEIVRLAEDIAGGLMVTMPSETDFKSATVVGREGETIGDICNKYFAAREGVSTEDRQKVMRFLENMCLGAAAVGYRTESMHGAGSPQAQRIMIARQGNIQGKKKLAKNIAGIEK